MRLLLLSICCLGFFSFLEHRAVGLIHAANRQAQVDVVRGIVAGHPYWKAYQNRLLGPLAASGMSRLTGFSLEGCYEALAFVALFAANATCFFLFLGHGKNRPRAWLFTLAYAGSFVALQDAQWLYLWDYLDLTFMLLFAWMAVVDGGSLWRFAALFVVQLLNRESAEFIALWLVLDSVRRDRAGRVRLDFKQLGGGVLLGIVGILWTRFIRDTLCIQETGVPLRPEIHETASGQFLMLRVTLDLLREPLTVTSATLWLLLGALAYLLASAWRPLGARAWKVSLMVGALTAANLCLAFIFELRVWFMLLPWALCLAYVSTSRAPGGLPARVE